METLDKFLQEEAKGFSLHSLYEKVPDCLKGYVELVYDLNNHPSFRIKESLLYKSAYYKPGLQSVSLYLIHADDDRPLSSVHQGFPNLIKYGSTFHLMTKGLTNSLKCSGPSVF